MHVWGFKKLNIEVAWLRDWLSGALMIALCEDYRRILLDMEYGVKVFNKFDISALGEDDDPYDILKRVEAQKKDEKAKDLKEKSSKSVSKSGKQSKKAQVTAQEQQKNRQNESSSFKQDGKYHIFAFLP